MTSFSEWMGAGGPDQAQQDLLGADEVVAEAAGLFLGQHDHLDGLLGKPLEHGRGLLRVHPTYQGWPGECGECD